MATLNQILLAATAADLGRWATGLSCAAITAQDRLEHSFFVSLVQLLELARRERGLAPVRWAQQGERELAFRIPSTPPPARLSLDSFEPEDIGWLASLLATISRHIQREDSAKAKLSKAVALALDANLPSRPGRGNAALN